MPASVEDLARRIEALERTQAANMERLLRLELWRERFNGGSMGSGLSPSTWGVIAIAVAISVVVFMLLTIVMRPGLGG